MAQRNHHPFLHQDTELLETCRMRGGHCALQVPTALLHGGRPWGRVIKQSALFDGASEATVALSSPSTTFTISWWEFICAPSVTNEFSWSFSDGTDANTIGFVRRTTTSFGSVYQGSAAGYADSAAALKDTTAFAHMALVSTAGVGVLSMNGVAIKTGIDTSKIANATALHIGSFRDNSNYANIYITGFAYVDGTASPVTTFIDAPGSSCKAINPLAAVNAGGANGGYYEDIKTGTDLSVKGNDLTTDAGVTSTSHSPTNNRAGTVGNFATWNPLTVSGLTLSNGNKTGDGNGSGHVGKSTLAIPPDRKIYWEQRIDAQTADNRVQWGICYGEHPDTGNLGQNSTGLGVVDDGSNWDYITGGSNTLIEAHGGTGATVGTRCMGAYDPATGKLWAGADGTWFGSGNPAAGTGEIATIPYEEGNTFIAFRVFASGDTITARFAPDEWTETAPEGFVSLNTANFPTVTGSLSEHFTASPRTGNGNNSTAVDVNDLYGVKWGKQIDLLVSKPRSNAASWLVQDTLRTPPTNLYFDTTAAEDTTSYVTDLGVGEFTIGANAGYNTNTWTYIDYGFNLPSDEVNSSGDISVTWKSNAVLGLAIGTYTGTGTAGHTLGLPTINGTAPIMMVHKRRDNTSDWEIFHETMGATVGAKLNDTAAFGAGAAVWNGTAPTASVVTLSNSVDVNASGGTYVIIVFWETDFCRSFTFEGNNSADGAFIYAAGSPAFALQIPADTAAGRFIHDNVRDPDNVVEHTLLANAATAEDATTDYLDFVATGIKHRRAGTPNPASTVVGVGFVDPLGLRGAGQLRAA